MDSGKNVEPSSEQKKLFGLMSDFTVTVVLGWVACIYAKLGFKIAAGNALVDLVTPFAEQYFNLCARLIYSREDKFINEKFDEMTAVVLKGKNEAIDVLHLIVMLSLNALRSMDIKDVITPDPRCLEAVRGHLRAVVARQSHLASSLIGCTDDHFHEPIREGEKIFTFTIDKYVNTEKGPVKLTTLEL